MFRSEDYKDNPALNKKGYLYKVEKNEKGQRDMIFAVGWDKIGERTEDNVEFFTYPHRQTNASNNP